MRGPRQFTGLALLLLSVFISLSCAAQQGRMTAVQLSREIMSYHDNYQEGISETIDELINAGVDPAARLLYQTIKVFYTQSSIDIASDSDAIRQLIDMLIMLRLQRLVWDAGGHQLSTPAQAAALAATIGQLEQQLHALAGRVLAASDIELIMKLAADWKQENPDRDYIAFVRFNNLKESVEKVSLGRTISGGGLFSLTDTNQEIEEARYALERALFVAHHMPILLEWQAELLMYRALATGEIQDILDQSAQTVLAMQQVSGNIEKLPADVQGVLEQNREPFLQMSQSLEATSANLRVISEQLSPLFLEGDNNLDGQVDLVQIQAILRDAHAATGEIVRAIEAFTRLNQDPGAAGNVAGALLDTLDRTDRMLEKHVVDIDTRLQAHRWQLYYMLASLCVLFPLVCTLCYLAVRRATARGQAVS